MISLNSCRPSRFSDSRSFKDYVKCVFCIEYMFAILCKRHKVFPKGGLEYFSLLVRGLSSNMYTFYILAQDSFSLQVGYLLNILSIVTATFDEFCKSIQKLDILLTHHFEYLLINQHNLNTTTQKSNEATICAELNVF